MIIDKKFYLDGTEKVGDKVWSFEKWRETGNGEAEIISINYDEYNIEIYFNTISEFYTENGLYSSSNVYPSLFKSNPFIPEFPKMMEVSDNQKKWMILTVYGIKYNDKAPFITDAGHYMYAREIQTKPKLSEILKEKGIDINQFENDL